MKLLALVLVSFISSVTSSIPCQSNSIYSPITQNNPRFSNIFSPFARAIHARKSYMQKRVKIGYKPSNAAFADTAKGALFERFWSQNLEGLVPTSGKVKIPNNKVNGHYVGPRLHLDSQQISRNQQYYQELKNSFDNIWKGALNNITANIQEPNGEAYFNAILGFHCYWYRFINEVRKLTKDALTENNHWHDAIVDSSFNSLQSRIINLLTVRDKFWSKKAPTPTLPPKIEAKILIGNRRAPIEVTTQTTTEKPLTTTNDPFVPSWFRGPLLDLNRYAVTINGDIPVSDAPANLPAKIFNRMGRAGAYIGK